MLKRTETPWRAVTARLPRDIVDRLESDAREESRDRTKQLVHVLREHYSRADAAKAKS